MLRLFLALRHLYRRWYGIKRVRRNIAWYELVFALQDFLPAYFEFRMRYHSRYRYTGFLNEAKNLYGWRDYRREFERARLYGLPSAPSASACSKVVVR